MKQKITVREMALIAVMAAVTCVLGPLSIPIGPVPISFTNLAVYLAIYVLGCRRGTVSYLVYLLIGLAGVPVFSGFTGGVGKLFGPTGGYLIGFLFMALVCGWAIDRFDCAIVPSVVGMVLGTAVCYVFGTAWLALQAHLTFYAALALGVLPFLAGDAAKIAVAACVGPQLRRRLVQAGLGHQR
ncbi:MAG TPA: biotin transporter BioY [Clostridiales bacterium]|nr:biotin transporter BioY [Clostridiales bacterium]